MIQRAASLRQAGTAGYDSDCWGAIELHPGDLLYGGWPGQTEYYTDSATVKAFGHCPTQLWAALQVHPSAQYGRRAQLAEYEVLWPVSVPAGRCRNNTTYGSGGGFQFMITNADQLLHKKRILDLHSAHLEV